jgi:hypothetical protein
MDSPIGVTAAEQLRGVPGFDPQTIRGQELPDELQCRPEDEHLIPRYALERAHTPDPKIVATYFAERGFAPVSGLISTSQIAALRRYYRQLIRTGKMHLGDDQSARRYGAYNDPAASYFLLRLAERMCGYIGQRVKPSYVYTASYLEGANLEPHTDRSQCEFTVTLCIDYAPEPESQTPWPIHLVVKGGTVTVFQALGDALLFRGCEILHYRNQLPSGQCSTSIFFHYVREDFDGPLC